MWFLFSSRLEKPWTETQGPKQGGFDGWQQESDTNPKEPTGEWSGQSNTCWIPMICKVKKKA
jgi:hypothetical protein